VEDEGKYINYPMFAFDDEKLFETYHIIIKPVSRLYTRPHLKGADVLHAYKNTKTSDVELSMLIYYNK
jgi:hypothetical protein